MSARNEAQWRKYEGVRGVKQDTLSRVYGKAKVGREKCVLQLGKVEGPRTVRPREMFDHDVGVGKVSEIWKKT